MNKKDRRRMMAFLIQYRNATATNIPDVQEPLNTADSLLLADSVKTADGKT